MANNMQLTIESTDVLTEIDGVPVRLWNGRTEAGATCRVYVHLIETTAPHDPEFEQKLRERPAPQQYPPEIAQALEESLKLQSHYARLLNAFDGGKRLEFKDAAAWIERLRETNAERAPEQQEPAP